MRCLLPITACNPRSCFSGSAILDERFYYFPEPGLTLEAESVSGYVDAIDTIEPDLIIFDSWINYIAGAGLDENVSGDIAKWAVSYTHPARSREMAVLLLDHVPKDGNNGARGSGRKRDEVDVQWKLKNTLPFDRDSVGEIIIMKEKDRDGWLPPSVTFSVGGGPTTNGFVFERSSGTTESAGSDGLTDSMRQMLDVLIRESRANQSKTAENDNQLT